MEQALRGDMRHLPPLSSQLVRLFISSTFSDLKEERNMLMEEVYPQMKNLCRCKYGLEFQVVDMRWGVRDEATDDHLTSSLCCDEIRLCQQRSVGPNFVVLLGQRYGHQALPASIAASEFEEILGVLSDASLLTTWYVLDHNALDKVYVLQPVSSLIPDFLSQINEKRLAAQRQWSEVSTELQKLLREGATICSEQGSLSLETKNKFFMSVTEEEIKAGIHGNRCPSDHCLCVVRVIDDVDVTHPLAARFVELVPGDAQVDARINTQLTHLRDTLLAEHLPDNTLRSVVSWDPERGGVSSLHKTEHLQRVRDYFHRTSVALIERAVAGHRSLSAGLSEVLHHLHLAAARCLDFHGRLRQLERVEQRLLSGASALLAVHGPSGSGKTSIMAKCTQLVPEWCADRGLGQPVVVVRFLGTSPASSTIRRTLQSVCWQLGQVYGETCDIPDEFPDVHQLFLSLLSLPSKSKPLILIIDSIDQLTTSYKAHELGWLPFHPPDHVYIIVSTLPHEHGILERLRKKIDEADLVSVPVLGEQLGEDILRSWLTSRGRTLTDGQLAVVKEAFHYCGLPLYVRLVACEVLAWRSYYSQDSCRLSFTISDVISNLFQRLTKKHGETLVSHALGYVTASQGGLAENELDDLLSLDDDVLTDVFQYHVPPMRRFPFILWVRIMRDINDYLTFRETDGMRVIYWYHRQFIESAKSCFLSDSITRTLLHSNMSDYWLGIWYKVKKPFTYTESQRSKFKLASCHSSADRRVADQPLLFHSDEVSSYNLRKFNNLPYHLFKAERNEELKKQCLFNYTWLITKLRACSVAAVLQDLDLITDSDNEAGLLRNAISLAQSTLKLEPSTLSCEIIGRLSPHATPRNPYLRSLSEMCCSFSVVAEDNVLLPAQQTFGAVGGPLKFMLEHRDIPQRNKLVALSPDDRRLFAVTVTGLVLIWDLHQGEIIKELRLLPQDCELKFNVSFVSVDGRYMVCACAFHKEYNPVAIVDMQEDDVLSVVNLERCYPQIGFCDNYVLHKLPHSLLVTVLNKQVACFDFLTGRLLHDFGVIASSVCVAPSGDLAMFSVKLGQRVEVYCLRTFANLARVSLSGAPQVMVMDKLSEKAYVALSNSTRVETLDIMHREHDRCDVVVSGVIDTERLLDGVIMNMQLTPNDLYLVITTTNSIVVWDVRSSCCHRQLGMPDSVRPRYRVSSLTTTVSSDSSTLVGAYNEHLIVWDLARGKVERTLHGDASLPIVSLIISSNSHMAITCFERNKIIKVWDLRRADEVTYSPISLSSECRYISAAQQRDYVAVRSYDAREVRVLDVSSGTFVGKTLSEVESMKPAISREGQYVILRDYNALQGAVTAWSADTGRLVATFNVSSLSLMNLSVSAHSQYLATHSETNQDVHVSLWCLPTGRLLREFPLTQGGFSFLAFADNDKKLVVLRQYPLVADGVDCTLLVFDVDSASCLLTRQHVLKDSVHVLDRTEEILAIDTTEQVYRLVALDSATLATKREVALERTPVATLSFSVQCDVAVDADRTVFCLTTGRVLQTFTPPALSLVHRNTQLYPKMTSDGRHVVWLNDTLIKVGRVSDGKEVGLCYTHGRPLALQVSMSGTVCVGVDDGRIMLLRVLHEGETIMPRTNHRQAATKNQQKPKPKTRTCDII